MRGLLLVGPPVALAANVFANILAEIGRADDDDLEALRAGFIASPRASCDSHRVPLFDLDDLVVDLYPPAAAHDQVDLFLALVCMPEGEAIPGRDTLIGQGRLLELERLGGCPELQVWRAVEHRADVLKILLEIPDGERHDATLPRRNDNAGTCIAHATRLPTQRRTDLLRAEGTHFLWAPGREVSGWACGSELEWYDVLAAACVKPAAQLPVHAVKVGALQAAAVCDQVLRLEGDLVHVPEDAAAGSLGHLNAGRVGRAEHRAREPFGRKRVDDKRGGINTDIVELRNADVGVEYREERVCVDEQQAFAPLNDEHVGVPIIAAWLGVMKDASPAAH